jgi:hypothetical protein
MTLQGNIFAAIMAEYVIGKTLMAQIKHIPDEVMENFTGNKAKMAELCADYKQPTKTEGMTEEELEECEDKEIGKLRHAIRKIIKLYDANPEAIKEEASKLVVDDDDSDYDSDYDTTSDCDSDEGPGKGDND